MPKLFTDMWIIMLTLSPWLLLGLAVAGILYVFVPRDLVTKHLGGHGIGPVFKAAFFGVPLPLCSCGVIPAALGIKKQGASDGAAVSFLVSTPQTGVDSILVSAAFLGWPFAVFKLASAFITGLAAGTLVQVTAPSNAEAREEVSTERLNGSKLMRMYDFAVNELLHSIWMWLALGVVVSALIGQLPPDFFQRSAIFSSGILAMVAILLFSLPLYVCATSSVPIAAALVHAGMPTGAALVFLMAGPASNVATIGAIYRSFGARVLAIYLGTIAVLSIVFGYLFSFVLELGKTMPEHHEHGSVIAIGSAALLVAFFVYFAWKDSLAWVRRRQQSTGDEKVTLMVKGMSCKNCSGKVEQSLYKIIGVALVEIDLESGQVDVTGQNLDHPALSEAVRQAGFEIAEGCCSNC